MLSIKGLTCKISNKPILEKISFSVEKSEVFSVLGHNGSGKSSLLKAMMRIYPVEKQETCVVDLDGDCLDELEINERAQAGLAYIMQEVPTYTGISIEVYVKSILKEKFEENLIKEKFDLFGLDWEVYKSRYFDTHLSGGEKKKVEIITTFLMDKKVYLLDEVETSLDATSRQILKNWIIELANNGKSFVIVSHHEDLIKLAKEGILLCDGKVQQKGNIDKIYNIYSNKCESCQSFNNCG